MSLKARVTKYILENNSYICFNFLINNSKLLNFAIRSITHIRGHAYISYLVGGRGKKHSYILLERSVIHSIHGNLTSPLRASRIAPRQKKSVAYNICFHIIGLLIYCIIPLREGGHKPKDGAV